MRRKKLKQYYKTENNHKNYLIEGKSILFTLIMAFNLSSYMLSKIDKRCLGDCSTNVTKTIGKVWLYLKCESVEDVVVV